jgi:hypothetical protein
LRYAIEEFRGQMTEVGKRIRKEGIFKNEEKYLVFVPLPSDL